MKKVWLVKYSGLNNEQIVDGVFSSEEAAKNYVIKTYKKFHSEIHSIDIDEHEVQD